MDANALSGGSVGVADCSGSFAFDFDAWASAGVDPELVPGRTITCQFWYRDPGATFGAGLTDALEFALRP